LRLPRFCFRPGELRVLLANIAQPSHPATGTRSSPRRDNHDPKIAEFLLKTPADGDAGNDQDRKEKVPMADAISPKPPRLSAGATVQKGVRPATVLPAWPGDWV
jgi:hypothetical protein